MTLGYKQTTKKRSRKELKKSMIEMLNHDGAYILEIKVARESNVFPMIPSGQSVANTRFQK